MTPKVPMSETGTATLGNEGRARGQSRKKQTDQDDQQTEISSVISTS
jgi:hypothetical protein